MSKTKLNLVYQSAYQILIIVLPILTAPYISRVLGAEGIGYYSYSYSVVYYFVVFARLGINSYGNKLIAIKKKNSESLNKAFSNLYYLHFLISVIVLLVYFLYIRLTDDNKTYALICSIYIIDALLDINWLFFGLEKFKVTVTRNTILRIITIICVFLFVRTKSDTWKYILIMAAGSCLSQLILWGNTVQYVKFVKPEIKEIKKHIIPLLILFVPVIAVSFYKIMDKIMLKLLAGTIHVGLYENAEKIINIPMGLITAVGTVMLPRAAALLSEKKEESLKRSIETTTHYVMILAYALSFGLIAISSDFAPLFFGHEFIDTGVMISGLAVTIPFMSFANILRTQYLIPKGYNNRLICSVSAGAIVNLVINWLMIPVLKGNGAVIGTIIAEFTVFLVQAIVVYRELNIKKFLLDSIPFLLAGIAMGGTVYWLGTKMKGDFLAIFIRIIIGAFMYCSLSFFIMLIKKDPLVINFIERIRNLKG